MEEKLQQARHWRVNDWHMAARAPPLHARRMTPAADLAPAAIHTHDLSRAFPGGQGVDGLNLDVPAGSIYGFLGPNGAGKTTTIRLLLGLLKADRGEVSLLGEPLLPSRHALRRVGALVESPSLYGHLSGRDNLEVTRRLLGLPKARIDAVLARVELAGDAHRRVREYSLGMRQRLGIALALLGAPALLLLDEPANGLDPAGIADLRRLLRELAAEGTTIFVSSHLLSEVELVATHVGVLQAGCMRFQGPIEELRARVRPRLRIRCEPALRAAELLVRLGEQVDLDDDGSLSVDAAGRPAAELNRLLVEHGVAVRELQPEQASLESMFFGLTSGPALERAA
jgi:ABC-2 type transport system ATP-binding protein